MEDDLADMEPPTKRPRLSLFNEQVPDESLDQARYNNDLVLKNKWEAIFDKYSRDFTDVGDEIDLMTGEIVIDRGHLQSMETETDLGRFDSTNLLRVISETQENGMTYPGTEQLIQSIETIAEEVGADTTEGEDEEDRVRNPSRSTTQTRSESVNDQAAHLAPYASDNDSLFADERGERESSSDSLFENFDHDQIYDGSQEPGASVSEQRGSSNTHYTDEDDIIAKFGPKVGQEVIDLLGERQQAHIEPAWRIPIQIQPELTRRPMARPTHIPLAKPSSPSHLPANSIWKAVKPVPKPSVGVSQGVRDESEDPLQEEFSTNKFRPEEYYSSEGYIDDGADSETESQAPNATQSPEQVLVLQKAKSGECAYCHKPFGNKSGVMAHWDRTLKKGSKLLPNDAHDLNLMRAERSRATRRVRVRRLTVGDFKCMVEFHEGAGMSFDEISKFRVLRTRKTGPQLQDVYHKHRTLPQLRETPEPERIWPAEEDKLVLELSLKPLSTMTTLRRYMKNRTELEIGNRLADFWINQLNENRIDTTPAGINPTSPQSRQYQQIKQESDDDLFD